MTKRQAFLSVGSNTGDSISIIISALKELNSLFPISGISSLYKTSPQVVLDQPDFYNCAVRIDIPFELRPEELLSSLWKIEAGHGRNRSVEQAKGPRSLDLDIILFGDEQHRSVTITVPHVAYLQRRFVLVPILEIAGNLKDPQSGRSLAEISRELEGDSAQGIYLSQSEQYNSFTSSLRI